MTLRQALKRAAAARKTIDADVAQRMTTEMTDDGFVPPSLADRARMNDLGIGFDDGDEGMSMDGF